MLRLFQAGVIAACIQCIAIVVLTPPVILYVQYRIEGPTLPNTDLTVFPVISLLPSIYLLIATGLALTRHRFVDLTATRIRGASRLMHPSEPDVAANALFIYLWIAAIVFAALTLSSPPSWLTEFGWHFGSFDAAPIIWSAFMSIGVASFGANAQAARVH